MTGQVAELAAGGERVAVSFEDFFDATWSDLVGFCSRATGDAELAQELAQEALTRVYVRYPLLREPRPYVFRVAANLVRRSWSARPHLLDDVPQVPGPDVSTIDAVRRLPDALRHVVLLHYWADLPVAEVARAVHRPEGTVKRRLHEARAQLAVTLGREFDA
jgi:RNA polymerase sigma-70 factor (ECF subfamily)